MNRHTHLLLYLAGCLATSLAGCASWSTGILSTSNSEPTFESTLSLARLSERHGEPATAERLYEAVLAKDPQNQLAHHRLAVLATKEQQFDQAQHHFDLALQGQRDSQLLNDWGYYLYLMDRLPEAETSLRESLQLDPKNIAAHNNLGLVLGTMGRTDESLKEFRYAGDEAAARANLAYVHSLNGKFDLSKAEYHRALELDSQLKPAAEALLALHARHDVQTASALSYSPTIPASTDQSSQHEPRQLQPSVELASQNVTANQADQSSSQIRTVSYAAQADGQGAATAVADAAPPPQPLMNMPTVNPTPMAGTAAEQSGSDQPSDPAPNFAAPTDAAPMSLQSSQPLPWQAPTWTPN